MDNRKLILITVLGILVAGLITALVLVFGNHHKKRSMGIGDLMAQERKYQNENFQSRVEADFRFRNEQRQSTRLYADRNFRKALLNYEAGLFREALEGFTDIKADSLDPEISAAAYYYMASCLLNLNEERRALVFLNRVIQNIPPNPWTTKCVILLGEINRKHQFSDESLEVYLHKLYMETADPEQKDAIITQIGYLKLFRDDLNGAMTHFQRGRSELARLGIARVYALRNMYWKAISIYEDMLEHRSFANSEYYEDIKDAFQKQTYAYARRWMSNGDFDHAYFYFRKIVNFFPNSIYGEASLFWIGEIFYTRRNWASALRYYNLVLSNGCNTKDADAQFKKGMTYFQMRQYAEAIRNFQVVIDYHKDSAYLERARQWISMSERELLYR
jgi:TolA-binding protein